MFIWTKKQGSHSTGNLLILEQYMIIFYSRENLAVGFVLTRMCVGVFWTVDLLLDISVGRWKHCYLSSFIRIPPTFMRVSTKVFPLFDYSLNYWYLFTCICSCTNLFSVNLPPTMSRMETLFVFVRHYFSVVCVQYLSQNGYKRNLFWETFLKLGNN